MVIQYSLWNATSRLIATNSPTLPRKTCKILKITGFNINTEITVITLKNIEPTACRLEIIEKRTLHLIKELPWAMVLGHMYHHPLQLLSPHHPLAKHNNHQGLK